MKRLLPKIATTDENRNFWLNSPNGKKVVEIFEDRMKQDGSQTQLLSNIARELNELGIPTYSGLRWNYSIAYAFWRSLQNNKGTSNYDSLPNKQQIIDIFKEGVAQGGSNTQNLMNIAIKLNELGIRTYTGKTWNYDSAYAFWRSLQKNGLA